MKRRTIGRDMSDPFAFVADPLRAMFEIVEELGFGLACGAPVKAASKRERQVVIADSDVPWDGGEERGVDSVIAALRNRNKGPGRCFRLEELCHQTRMTPVVPKCHAPGRIVGAIPK